MFNEQKPSNWIVWDNYWTSSEFITIIVKRNRELESETFVFWILETVNYNNLENGLVTMVGSNLENWNIALITEIGEHA